MAAVTDSALNGQFEQIRDEIITSANTKLRVYNAFKNTYDTLNAGKLNKGEYSIVDRDLWAFSRRVLSVFSHGMLEINHLSDFERGVRIYGPVYIDDLRTTPPPPDGVTFTTAPGAPTITTSSITETASVVDNEGVTVNIPSASLAFSLAAAGKHRYDAIVANYTGTPAYERITGTEVLTSEAAPTPATPDNRLFVRFLHVTDAGASLQAVLDDKADKDLTIFTYTASHTLVLANRGGMVRMNVASANTLTVPPNSSVAFPIGTQIVWSQPGAGQTTFVPGGGVTITPGYWGGMKSAGLGAGGTLIKVATDGWELHGNTSA